MTWLIDTNALSELKKRKPHPGVARWFQIQPPSGLHLSVVTRNLADFELPGLRVVNPWQAPSDAH